MFPVASQKASLPSCHSSTPYSAIPWAKNVHKGMARIHANSAKALEKELSKDCQDTQISHSSFFSR